ncbi:MAG: class I SAM-dependent methyltransferase [Caulobacteraceae bacterium]|nr:class I SAM-dependent methyltransferase [Caulobacteraceae bacterium]
MPTMRHAAAFASLIAIGLASVAVGHAATRPAIDAAVADPARPKADTDLDAARHPAELLAFADIKPGDRIIDVFPGPYWDRLFADVVGPGGAVTMFIPAEVVKINEAPDVPNGSHPMPDHPNVTTMTAPIMSLAVERPADIVWIRQNYHDLYDPFMGPADVPAFNRLVFKALRPGGRYVIIDHAAPAGTGIASTNTTHRIDPARVKADLAAAGFVFVRETDVLANPADDHSKLVFNPAVRGHTDQFVYLFRKP